MKVSNFLVLPVFVLAMTAVQPKVATAWTLLQLSAPNDGLEVTGWDMESRENILQFKVNNTNCSITDTELNSAIDDALELWNEAASGAIKLERNGTTTLQEPENPPSIYCDNDASLGVDETGTAGIGGPGSVNTQTGEFVSGRLVLNSNPAFDADFANLDHAARVVIIAHEIGHVLGYGHSSFQPSIMYFSATGKTDPNWSQDDLNAISYLYGRSELGFEGIFGCAADGRGLGDSSSRAPDFFFFLFLLGGCFLLARRWAR